MKNIAALSAFSFGLAAMTVSIPALAFFHVDKNPPAPHCGNARVIQLGAGNAGEVSGNGYGVPLDKAMEALVPPGWTVKAEPKVAHMLVNWKAHTPWVEALANTPKTACFVVDWRKRWVVASDNPIKNVKKQESGGQQVKAPHLKVAKTSHKTATAQSSPSPQKGQQAVAQHEGNNSVENTAKEEAAAQHNTTTHAKQGTAHAKHNLASADKHGHEHTSSSGRGERTHSNGPSVPASHVVAKPMVAFEVHKGERLSTALTKFAKKYGWHVAWEDPLDYPIKYPMQIHDRTLKGVLSQITQIYPVRITLYQGNRVADVRSATSANTPIGGGENGHG